MFNKKDEQKNQLMLDGKFARRGYDWWWHSFTAIHDDTKKEQSFFIEFFVINPALSKKVVLGENGNHLPSYLMIKAGCWGEKKCQLHRFVNLDEVTIHPNVPFELKGTDFICNENHIQGCIDVKEGNEKNMSDSGSMYFDLTIDKRIAYNVGYGTSYLLRKLKAFEMYWHVSGMKSLYEGHIILNGERYTVTKEKSYGYADKNWGSDFTSPWVWLSSNCITSNITHQKLRNSAFDFGGGRPKIFCFPLNRKLLGGLYLEGKEYEYNFSKFWMLPKTQFHCMETADQIIWQIRFENIHTVCRVEVTCQKKDMLLVKYESPDGYRRHKRLWNGGNGVGHIQLYQKKWRKLELIDDLDVSHVGCEYGEYEKQWK